MAGRTPEWRGALPPGAIFAPKRSLDVAGNAKRYRLCAGSDQHLLRVAAAERADYNF